MMDVKGLREAQNTSAARHAAEAGGKGRGQLKFLSHKQLESGKYKFRVLPRDVNRCPRGFVISSYHGVTKDVGEKGIYFPCPSTYSEDPCYACEILDAIKAAKCKDLLPPDVWTEVDEVLRPSFSILYPTTWFVREEKVQGAKKEFSKFYADTSQPEALYIFEVSAKTVKDLIDNAFEKDPNLSHEGDYGAYLTLIKDGNQYSLEVGPKEPMQNPKLLAGYPNLAGFGAKKRLGYSGQESLFKSAYYRKDIEKYIEL